MQSQPPRKAPPIDPSAPSLTEGAELWSRLCAASSERARLDAEIVELTGALQQSNTIETLEGVLLDTALALVTRSTSADRNMQLLAGQVLADMPATMALFKAGELSWSMVRHIVGEVKRLPKDLRAVVDARIDASRDLIAKMSPDDFSEQVSVAVQDLRDARSAERSERAIERGNFLWAQPSMFGPGKVYGELDNVSLATFLTGVDAHAPADDGRSLAQRRADGLVAMAAHRCDGEPAQPEDVEEVEKDADTPAGDAPPAPPSKPTRHRRIDRALPAFNVIVDLRDASVNAAGIIQIAAGGAVPTITAAACEALAADATVRVLLVDGGRPLTWTRKVQAKALPEDVRRAVTVRDRGDRFPGSRRPIEHVHHLDRRGKGHHVDYLVGFSNPTHKRVHRNGWRVEVDPATAEVTFTRGERTWTTVPRGTRLRQPEPSP